MTPTEARAAFLWSLTTPEQIMAAATTPELREAAAKKLGVSLRTVQRSRQRPQQCHGYPQGSCLTWVNGGGLCSFCRRTLELEGRVG